VRCLALFRSVASSCKDAVAGTHGRSPAAFPQPRSLSAALLEMQLLVLGPLTAAVSEANQLQILGVGLSAACQCIRVQDSHSRCWLLRCPGCIFVVSQFVFGTADHTHATRCVTPQVMKSAVAAEGSRDQAAVIAVCCAAIAGLSALAAKHRSKTPASPLHRSA
jgi:hypothetical protein